ncbi:SDR family NAD(P)-dependent oxidoreductase [Nocardioides nitrophenolicus]|uniref:SDR family NAD(P)-dependent oxidoreductase n=1 Tax=Nocardioides nitrophenolicus TaxID=60489 RepID=UPI00195A8BDD|nr:SDR family NAD(P)-dependent oxidoreductase [Nocardioides nitrophenolicus]MBM7518163.1 NAD(P)-dependent dehydrogenase (short-subunit alcohol dehydrogenase family) [Nocardioides nitrophenolicus]
MNRFEGQVALVTGGASGIGRATGDRLADEGARVWVLDRDGQQARAAADEIHAAGGSAEAAELDVTDADAFDGLVREILGREGRIDVLVNNAGVTLAGAVWETTSTDWAQVIGVNLTGVFNGIRTVIPAMIESGRGAIVSTSSDAGLVGWPGQAAYCASKSGVLGLTRASAMDAAAHGVRVNAVCPGFTRTPLVERWIAECPDPAEALREIAAEQPLGRVADPSEIAAAIAFLASDEAGFITGVAFPVDGGVTAR